MRRGVARRGIWCGAVVSLMLAVPAAAAATTFTVGGFGDAVGTCSGTVCTSLRAAVDAVNANPGSTISLNAGTYTLGNGAPVGTGELLIDATGSGGAVGATITGVGPGQTVIRQTDGKQRVLDFNNGGPYELENLEVTGGDLTGPAGGVVQGGGVYANATVRLDHVLITGNTVAGGAGASTGSGSGSLGGSGEGGGFFDTSGNSTASATVAHSTISGNFATGGVGGSGTTQGGEGGNGVGGGVMVDGYSILDSTLSGNHATGGAGGADTASGPAGQGGVGVGGGSGGINNSSQLLLNDTVTGNTAAGGLGPGQAGAGNGGGIGFDNPGHQLFDSDTITGNTASGGAGSAAGNVLLSGTQGLTMADTVIAGGIAPALNNCAISGQFVDNGHNLGDDATNQCGLTAAKHDLLDTAPGLGSLEDNGGPAETELPSAGSALIGAGGACTDPTSEAIPGAARATSAPSRPRPRRQRASQT
jgi:hypothetical protein